MSFEISDFQKDVIERSKTVPVLVDFWAEWCAPCRILGPVLEKLAQNSNGRWVLAKVDTEVHKQVAMEYGIRGIPNVKLFIDGKPADEFTGALPEYAVTQWLEKALPNEFQKDIEKAQALLETGKEKEAQAILSSIIKRDSENHLARTLLAKSLFSADPARSLELVEGIEEDSEHFPLAEAIRNAGTLFQKFEMPERLPDDPVKKIYLQSIGEMRSGNYDSALKGFIEVIRKNRFYDDDNSRLAVIAIFRLIGEDHELTQKHRRDFGSALNV